MCNFYKIGNKTICRLGEFLFVISILVLVGSLLFVMVYALFFNNEYEYFDFITPLTNNLKSQLAYCTFGCLKKLATF